MTASLFLELEITQRCPLQCAHCYSQSGPTAPHGTLTADDWRRVITDAADLSEATTIQFIGGEPTSHPAFVPLMEHAITSGVNIEVFTNLYRVRDSWWDLFSHPRVSLATSYYSDQPADHDHVTGRAGSHTRTRANIAEAVRRSIPIRVGIVDIHDAQRAEQAHAEMTALGITNIGIDRIRGVGRGTNTLGAPNPSELCGRCGDDKAAITAFGDVYPCVLSRFLHPAGNVHTQHLRDILNGPAWDDLMGIVPHRSPTACKPDNDGNDCSPAETETCSPSFCNPD